MNRWDNTKIRLWVCGFLFILLSQGTAPLRGDVYKDKSFSLRFPAALGRFSPYSDVGAGGGASVGSKWASSYNPASADWDTREGAAALGFTPQFSYLDFNGGNAVCVTAESFVIRDPQLGTFIPICFQAHSNHHATSEGIDFEYDMNACQIQWSKRFTDDMALGWAFQYNRSTTDFEWGPYRLSTTEADGYAVRLGALYRPVERWFVGLATDVGFMPADTKMPPFPGGPPVTITSHDTACSFTVRPGIGYYYQKESAVYLDYDYSRYDDDSGELNLHRMFAGVDHNLFTGFFVRTGLSLDFRGPVGWTTGLGFYPNDWFTIDAAFQEAFFPELRPDFGTARNFMVSLGLSF